MKSYLSIFLILFFQIILIQSLNSEENLITDAKLLHATINSVEIKGSTLSSIQISQLNKQLKQKFKGFFFKEENSKAGQKVVKNFYNLLGFPYVFLDYYFLKENNKKQIILEIHIRENPIKKIEVRGTVRREAVLEIMEIAFNKPYNIFEMEQASQKLFQSDLFNRYFTKLSITPYYLKENGIVLGVFITEKKSVEVEILARDAKSYRIYNQIAVEEPSLYGTNNRATLHAGLSVLRDVGSWDVGLLFSDYYLLQESNKIRYQLSLYQENHDNSANVNTLGASLEYAYQINNLLYPWYGGLGYDYHLSDDKWLALNNSSYHSIFALIYFNNSNYLIFSEFNNQISLKVGYSYYSGNEISNAIERRWFLESKLLHWYKISKLFWIESDLQLILPSYNQWIFSERKSSALWSSLAQDNGFFDLSFYWKNQVLMAGPFAEIYFEQSHVDNEKYLLGTSLGISTKITWLSFVSQIDAGFSKDINENWFIHYRFTGKF